MRRITLFLAMVLFTATAAVAQNYIVVDSEQIFKSLDAYNSALASIDTLADEYQSQVDSKFEEVESLYQSYMARKASLSQDMRQSVESEILKKEAQAVEFQESIFSEQGELFKKRVELIAPIQQRVFSAIESYAVANGFDAVMDLASNPTMLYISTSINRTEAIIELLKN
ncbi:MAG: OmpH family outer membrane protein [Rikenellaceae bacterium]